MDSLVGRPKSQSPVEQTGISPIHRISCRVHGSARSPDKLFGERYRPIERMVQKIYRVQIAIVEREIYIAE